MEDVEFPQVLCEFEKSVDEPVEAYNVGVKVSLITMLSKNTTTIHYYWMRRSVSIPQILRNVERSKETLQVK